MLKCFAKMKTRRFLLGILYVSGIFHSFSNSQGIVADKPIQMYFVNSTSTQYLPHPVKRSVDENLEKPKICQQRIITNINNRYASTAVTTKLMNPISKSQEYMFSFHVPNNAFITKFVFEMDDKNYTSTVLEKEDANKQFKRTSSSKSSEPSENFQIRNTQKFQISITLESFSVATLYLTYEELLSRNQGQYEHVVNIFPGQLIEDLRVEIFLKETSKILDLKIPNLRSGNEIENQNKGLNPHAYISTNSESEDSKSVKVLFIPNEEEQIKFARIMKTDENRGFAGQFVIQYDVENNKKFGEIVISKGYFANFFAPKGLEPLVKHLIFVLDTSGSMNGKRIKQLKIAMEQMLKQLRKNDLVSLVEFNSQVKVWNLETFQSVLYSTKGDPKEIILPKPSLATPEIIKKAVDCVNQFIADGGTDILSSLKAGLKLVELAKNFDTTARQPLIMFLTDGEPTVGEKSLQRIKEQVTTFNWGLKRSPISTLAFGDVADQDFLLNLALLNMGFFKHIYDADDSQLQIENFFRAISVPVLANVNFNYSFETVTNVTLTEFPLCYDGLELVVAGQYNDSKAFQKPVMEALTNKGPLKKQVPQIYKSNSNLENLWAFLTTKQLLNKVLINSSGNPKDDIKKVVDVSLKYSFVTPFTSMVVATPNEKFVLGTAELTGQTKSNNGFSIDDTMKYSLHG